MSILEKKFDTEYGSVPFSKIKEDEFIPALKKLITESKERIDTIKQNTQPNFANTCEALEANDRQLDQVAGVFFNLHSAESTESLRDLAKDVSPLLSEYSNDILLDPILFSKVKEVYEKRSDLSLSVEEKMLVEKQYKGFVNNGALCSEEEKDKLREIDKEMSKLTLVFSDNVLKETQRYLMVLDSEDDLAGLPDGTKEAAAMLAKEKNHEGKWAISLDYPSCGPFMKYSEKRDLRKALYMEMASKSYKNDEFDNQENIKNILKLRNKRAKLLGFKTHAEFVLQNRMATTPDKVFSFLEELLEKAFPKAKDEMNELKEFAKKSGLEGEMMPWDFSFYEEKFKQVKLDLDEESLKPYFKLENVIDGAFEVANKLYGIKFVPINNIDTYHEDVKTFKVENEDGSDVGILYADFFPRDGKRSGAWMTSYRSQYMEKSEDKRPHISIVCNFTKPTDSKPSLLTFGEVTTLFHEFGHALHGLLSKCKYQSLAGTSVYWDFVELPSQIMENWCFEKECLSLFAKHYETGEVISDEAMRKLKEKLTFMEARQTMRQLSFSLLDMKWHTTDPDKIKNIGEFENSVMEKTRLLPKIEGTSMSCAFSHIFAGGYSAGYYSYKWAEVLDADAFSVFKEKGIFNKEVALKFRTEILEKGGSQHPMELYKNFKGGEPSVDPLLKRAGLA